MQRKDISSLSQRELALSVLSKLLYAIADRIPGVESIITSHQKILKEYLCQNTNPIDRQDSDPFSIQDIPWDNILDSISSHNSFLDSQIRTQRFSTHEIRYMCAMMCGLSGKEYGLITGFKSHYNLSWSIRQKFKLPPKATNLRIFLHKLSENGSYESLPVGEQK